MLEEHIFYSGCNRGAEYRIVVKLHTMEFDYRMKKSTSKLAAVCLDIRRGLNTLAAGTSRVRQALSVNEGLVGEQWGDKEALECARNDFYYP